MSSTPMIPEDVLNTPADPDGDGFLTMGIYAPSILGSDGRLYVRKNGVVSLDTEFEKLASD